LTAALILWLGPRHVARLARSQPVPAWATAITIQLGVALNRLWEVRWGPEVHVDLGNLGDLPDLFPNQAGRYLQGAVGWFGYQQIELPAAMSFTWGAMLAILLIAALALAPWWRRTLLAVTAVGVVLLLTVMYIVIIEQTGFGVLARHVLAAAVVLPLLAGDAVQRSRRARTLARWSLLAVAVPAAVIHLVAWWTVARWGAVGSDGPVWFFDDAGWTPPLGWLVWAVVAVLGAAALVAAGVSALRTTEPGQLQLPPPRA
jgi:hypothetical protein